MRQRAGIVTDEQFVTAWAKSRSIHDMTSRTGLSKEWIYLRASRMRKRGVQLPRWRELYPVTVDRLNEILREMRGERA